MRRFAVAATEIGGVHLASTIRGESHDAYVEIPAPEIRLEGADRQWKSFAKDDASRKEASIGTGSGGKAPVTGAAAGERAEFLLGIDDQGGARRIAVDVEANDVAVLDSVPTAYGRFASCIENIGVGHAFLRLAYGSIDEQLVLLYRHLVDPFVLHGDLPHIPSRMNDDIILHLTIVGIIADIDIGINILIGDALVDGAVTGPFGGIVSDEVVVIGRKGLVGNDRYLVAGAEETDPVSMGMQHRPYIFGAGRARLIRIRKVILADQAPMVLIQSEPFIRVMQDDGKAMFL